MSDVAEWILEMVEDQIAMVEDGSGRDYGQRRLIKQALVCEYMESRSNSHLRSYLHRLFQGGIVLLLSKRMIRTGEDVMFISDGQREI